MPELDLGPAIEAVLGVLPIDPDDSTTPTACDGRGICAWSPARKHAQRIVEAALPELRKAIAEEMAQRMGERVTDALRATLPIDPSDGTTVLRWLDDGVPLWGDPDEVVDSMTNAVLAAIVRGQSETAGPGFSGTGAWDRATESGGESSNVELVTVVHALTHAVDKLATAKAALREILHAHGGCMAAVMAEQWRAVLADLDAEPDCVRGQSGGGE